MGRVRYKRNQKYKKRTRYIYALLFTNGCCYIGQTVDTDRRFREHKSQHGGWGYMADYFTPIVLSEIHATQQEAEDHEFAWRFKANKNGWDIYGLPPNIKVSPRRKMNWRRRLIATRCKWPSKHRVHRNWSFLWKWPAIAISVWVGLGVMGVW